MATKTFEQLKLALASLWGFEAVEDLLAQDVADIESYINAAYFDCFAPVDGSRPNYSERYFSKILKAPVVATLGLTQGSTVVTGHAFEDDFAGSFVKIGDSYLRYSGSVTTSGDTPVTTYHLLQPWQGATGDFVATIYFNALALDANVIEVCGIPNLVGIGTLSPMPDGDFELKLRSEPAPDFTSRSGRGPFATQRTRFNPSVWYDAGEPRYYYIDSASVGPSFAVGDRVHVYPVPDRIMTLEFKANVVPATLSEASDVPEMAAGAVDNILLPLAKEKLAENTAGRRFTGNVQLIMAAANRAREQLKSLSRKQRHTAGAFRPAKGW